MTIVAHIVYKMKLRDRWDITFLSHRRHCLIYAFCIPSNRISCGNLMAIMLSLDNNFSFFMLTKYMFYIFMNYRIHFLISIHDELYVLRYHYIPLSLLGILWFQVDLPLFNQILLNIKPQNVTA